MFSTQSDNCIPIVHTSDILSLFAAEFEEPKIGISGKGLIFQRADFDENSCLNACLIQSLSYVGECNTILSAYTLYRHLG